LQRVFSEAQRLYDQGGPQYYQGGTLAPVAGQTNQAIDAATQRALGGNALNPASQNVALNTLNGQYMSADSNPYMQQMFDSVRAQVQPGIDGSFSAAGRTGSGMHGRAIGEGLGSAFGNLAFNNYNNERVRQQQTMALSPTLANQDYFDIGQLANVGDTVRNLGQQEVNADIQRQNYNQNLPYLNLANYRQMIDGTFGGSNTTTATNPYYGPNLGGALMGAGAGAGAGYGIASLTGGNTTSGAGLGALGGGMLGGMK
jgi:hypothetical protein